MSEYGAPVTFTFPSSTLSFNPAAGGDGFYLTNVTGLDQAPLRITQEDKAQTDGANLHPSFRGARHITVEGYVLPVAGSTRNAACDDLVEALEAIENADGTWAWTQTGDSGPRSVTVRCDVPVTFSGSLPKSFIFGLVAADPTISGP